MGVYTGAAIPISFGKETMNENPSPTIRPWYRSLIFWLGAVGFAVVIWSWWDSFHFIRALHTPDRVEKGSKIVSYYSLHNRVGIIGVTHESIDYAQRRNGTLPDRGFSIQASPLSASGWANLRAKNSNPFQAPIAIYRKTDREIQTSYFYLAHWSFLIVYSIAWRSLYSLRTSKLRRQTIEAGHSETKQEAEQDVYGNTH